MDFLRRGVCVFPRASYIIRAVVSNYSRGAAWGRLGVVADHGVVVAHGLRALSGPGLLVAGFETGLRDELGAEGYVGAACLGIVRGQAAEKGVVACELR